MNDQYIEEFLEWLEKQRLKLTAAQEEVVSGNVGFWTNYATGKSFLIKMLYQFDTKVRNGAANDAANS